MQYYNPAGSLHNIITMSCTMTLSSTFVSALFSVRRLKSRGGDRNNCLSISLGYRFLQTIRVLVFLRLQQRDGNNLPANLPSRSFEEILENALLSSMLAVAPEGTEGRDPMIRGDSVATTDDYVATANYSNTGSITGCLCHSAIDMKIKVENRECRKLAQSGGI